MYEVFLGIFVEALRQRKPKTGTLKPANRNSGYQNMGSRNRIPKKFLTCLRFKLRGFYSKFVFKIQQSSSCFKLEWSNRNTRLHQFIPSIEVLLLKMHFRRSFWLLLNRLRTGVGSFYSSPYNWGIATTAQKWAVPRSFFSIVISTVVTF